MSIVTKKGDQGKTSLMYNRAVSKCHPRVEAYGTVDELNAAIGLARAAAEHPFIRDTLLQIQTVLVGAMGELATALEDIPRYEKDGYPMIRGEATSKLELLVREIEAQNISFKGWATPGDCASSAALDFARTVCRRSERMVCGLQESEQLHNPEILVYLNRLSDLLWLMARWVETPREAAVPADATPGATLSGSTSHPRS
jgi:cob(I)alamin adenosyltransferase